MKLFTILVSFLVFSFASYNYFCQFSNLSSYSYSSNATSYDIAANASVSIYNSRLDEYYELKKVLHGASNNENTVILTTLNKKYAEHNIFDLFLESFRIGNNTHILLNHLLVITYDKNAYSRCRALVRHCYLFESKHLEKSTDHKLEYMRSIYVDIMWERQELLHTILSFGYNFVYTDVDVMWFRDLFPNFYPEADFQISCDKFNGNPYDWNNFGNNGFNFVRSNKRTIEFFRLWISARKIYPRLNEQDVFNKIKRRQYIKKIGLKFRHLDTNYFSGICSPGKDLSKVCTIHANCCVGLDKKLDDLNLLLEDWKMYLSLQPNERRKLTWRVPKRCDFMTGL